MEANTLHKLEAVLFAYGRLVGESELQSVLGLSSEQLNEQLALLKEKHEAEHSALQLISESNLWKLTVKDEHLNLVKGIVTKTELDRPTMETLAVIAFRYPIMQSEVIEMRNAGAYEHIKSLSDLGYVIKERKGRSYQLKLTSKFFDYFDLPREKLKEVFAKQEDLAATLAHTELQSKQLKQKEQAQNKTRQVKEQHNSLDKFSEQ